MVGKFNFYMHKMAKNYEIQNRQLRSEVLASNAVVERLTKEREDLVCEKKAMQKRYERLIAQNVAANAEAERLQKELTVLRMEREQRRHSDKRKMKEFQLIRERLSKRNSESATSPTDSHHSTASTVHPLHHELMPDPLQGSGMRRRVLSFASGLDLRSSSEIQRLSLENEHYQYKLCQLEQKLQYLREEIKQQDSQSEPPISASERQESAQKQPSQSEDTHVLVLKGCLEESLEENVTLRSENSKLKQELEEVMAARMVGSSPVHMLEKVDEGMEDVNKDKEGCDSADTDTTVKPASYAHIVQEVTSSVMSKDDVDGIASDHDLIMAASRRSSETVEHICNLLSQCVTVRSSLYLESFDEIDSTVPDDLDTAVQPCNDALITGTDDMLCHGNQLCMEDGKSDNLPEPVVAASDDGPLVKATPQEVAIPCDAWQTKADLTTVDDP